MKTKDQTVYAIFQTDNYYVMDGSSMQLLIAICKTQEAADKEIKNQKKRLGKKQIEKCHIQFSIQPWKVLV